MCCSPKEIRDYINFNRVPVGRSGIIKFRMDDPSRHVEFLEIYEGRFRYKKYSAATHATLPRRVLDEMSLNEVDSQPSPLYDPPKPVGKSGSNSIFANRMVEDCLDYLMAHPFCPKCNSYLQMGPAKQYGPVVVSMQLECASEHCTWSKRFNGIPPKKVK